MRMLLVLICSLALACAAGGAQEKNKSKKTQKKKQAQTVQRGATSVGHQPGGGLQKTKASQHVTASGGRTKTTPKIYRAASKGTHYQKTKPSHHVTTAQGRPAGAGAQKTKGKTKASQQIVTQSGQAAGGRFDYGRGGTGKVKTQDYHVKKSKGRTTKAVAVQSSSKTYKARRFNLQTNTRPTRIAAVTFQQNRRIQGSDRWVGSNYQVFRNYRSEWHDRDWWRRHHSRVVFVFGGWYAWNAGWWYPAWGYDPNAYYAYDGPIYGYDDLPPDQVIANVQAALQQQGYYQGEVDGLLGPLTRGAIADYQRDHGLYITSAIDRPTLQSLGMA